MFVYTGLIRVLGLNASCSKDCKFVVHLGILGICDADKVVKCRIYNWGVGNIQSVCEVRPVDSLALSLFTWSGFEYFLCSIWLVTRSEKEIYIIL